jgi:dipeptidyl aminopeptidase/acylaminoacyl peptidase
MIGLGLVAAFGLSAGVCVGQGAGATTAAKRPMTFADLMAMKRVSDPQISPSGKWVLFSVTEVNLEKNTKVTNLWVVPIGGGKERQLTFGEVSQTNGRFSPDGKWISLTSAGGGSSQIWTAAWDDATGTMQKPYPLTNVSTEADGAIWSPDSQRLLFVSSVYPECSDKPTWPEEDACNKAKDDAAAKTSVKAQVWDELLYRHWDHYTGEKRSHVLVVSRANGEEIRDLTRRSAVGDAETPTFSLGGPIGYAWAPDSKEIAYITNLDKVPAASTNNDVFTLQIDVPDAKAVKISTSPGSDDGPAYSPDGKYLAFRSQARNGFESDLFRLMVMDRTTRAVRDVAPPAMTNQQKQLVNDNWIDEFSWAPDSKRIAYASPEKGQEILTVIPVVSGPDTAMAFWYVKAGELGSLVFAPNGTIVATQMFEHKPTELVTIKHTSSSEPGYDIVSSNTDVKSLTDLNGSLLSSLDLPKMEPFRFKGAEGSDVEGFMVKPPNFDPAKKYPLKFLMHGGPQTAWGDSWSYRWNWELMAASGYVVIGINRRGSTGYGQKFVDEVSGDWGGRAYEDLMKGLDYAEQHYSFIDKDRECALGGSYGGFMANWVLTHTNRFKCIVTHDGLYDPVSAYGTTEEMWFNEWEFRRPEDFPAGWDGFAGAGKSAGQSSQPWRYQNLPAEQDPFRKWSPMLHIKDAKTPTLIIHSQRDYRLDVSQGFELFTALQRMGVPSKFLYFPDEGHWVLKPQNSQLWNATVEDWCDRWTKSGRYATASK